MAIWLLTKNVVGSRAAILESEAFVKKNKDPGGEWSFLIFFLLCVQACDIFQ